MHFVAMIALSVLTTAIDLLIQIGAFCMKQLGSLRAKPRDKVD